GLGEAGQLEAILAYVLGDPLRQGIERRFGRLHVDGGVGRHVSFHPAYDIPRYRQQIWNLEPRQPDAFAGAAAVASISTRRSGCARRVTPSRTPQGFAGSAPRRALITCLAASKASRSVT